MLKSMTAYGRSCVSLPLGRFVVEIQSVNRKHLEIDVNLSRELSRFDGYIKRWISSVVYRGKITVRVFVHIEADCPIAVSANIPLVKQLKKAWEDIAKETGLNPSQAFHLDLISDQPGVLLIEENIADENEYKEALRLAVHDALVNLQKMRETEGSLIERDICKRLDWLAQNIALIEEKSPNATAKFREKLKARE